jgi:hypothetical protein
MQEAESVSMPGVWSPDNSTTRAASTMRQHTCNTAHHSYGRPDFQSTAGALSRIQTSHAGEVVGVFYCGPPALGHKLEGNCRQLNTQALKLESVARVSGGVSYRQHGVHCCRGCC